MMPTPSRLPRADLLEEDRPRLCDNAESAVRTPYLVLDLKLFLAFQTDRRWHLTTLRCELIRLGGELLLALGALPQPHGEPPDSRARARRAQVTRRFRSLGLADLFADLFSVSYRHTHTFWL